MCAKPMAKITTEVVCDECNYAAHIASYVTHIGDMNFQSGQLRTINSLISNMTPHLDESSLRSLAASYHFRPVLSKGRRS